MIPSLNKRLARLLADLPRNALDARRIGLEKEALRTGSDGLISRAPHPGALGSALTHPYITTDYAEPLLELITPPLEDRHGALDFLHRIHQFVYQHIGEELLWAASMPCVVAGEDSVPIAEYGPSNPGRMRHIYRRGLGYRYGKIMQVISGVHMNYSLPDSLWETLRELEGDDRALIDYISDGYFRMIRNQQRYGWLIYYLCGASPAVCKSYFGGNSPGLAEFDRYTCYGCYATSLRMSDIGYQNKKKAGLRVPYDNLDAYVDALDWATRTPYPEYERIGVVVNGEWRQLNTNILQIENEYYSSSRPKQTTYDGERPVVALKRRGVGYLELRSLDMDPYSRLGIDEPRLRFLEAFLLTCAVLDSPLVSGPEAEEIDYNQSVTACRGRDPGLLLRHHSRLRPLRDWGRQVLDMVEACAELLDRDTGARQYGDAVAAQRPLLDDPDETPSARILEAMRGEGESFFEFALRLSKRHADRFKSEPIPPDTRDAFRREATASLERQQAIEAAETECFESYLERYFAQRP